MTATDAPAADPDDDDRRPPRPLMTPEVEELLSWPGLVYDGSTHDGDHHTMDFSATVVASVIRVHLDTRSRARYTVSTNIGIPDTIHAPTITLARMAYDLHRAYAGIPLPAREEPSIVTKARAELAIDSDPENPEDAKINDAVIELLTVFAGQGHSGPTAEACVALFYELANWRPLTDLTYEPDEWEDHTEESGSPMWQNRRDSTVFTEDEGITIFSLEDTTRRPGRRPIVGDHVHHWPTGAYLGVVTDVLGWGVRFDGPRTRDGAPVTTGGFDEVVVGAGPNGAE